MSNRFRLAVFAAVFVAATAETIMGLALVYRTPPQAGRACLNIGENVCLSGSVAWVARAAAASSRRFGAMPTMLADAN